LKNFPVSININAWRFILKFVQVPPTTRYHRALAPYRRCNDDSYPAPTAPRWPTSNWACRPGAQQLHAAGTLVVNQLLQDATTMQRRPVNSLRSDGDCTAGFDAGQPCALHRRVSDTAVLNGIAPNTPSLLSLPSRKAQPPIPDGGGGKITQRTCRR